MKNNISSLSKTKTFDMEDLAGRTLKVVKTESDEAVVVGAIDVITGEVFILKSELKTKRRGK